MQTLFAQRFPTQEEPAEIEELEEKVKAYRGLLEKHEIEKEGLVRKIKSLGKEIQTWKVRAESAEEECRTLQRYLDQAQA